MCIDSKSGALINSINSDSSLLVSGIQEKDVLIQIEKENITNTAHISRALALFSCGDRIILTVIRGGPVKNKKLIFVVTIDCDTLDGPTIQNLKKRVNGFISQADIANKIKDIQNNNSPSTSTSLPSSSSLPLTSTTIPTPTPSTSSLPSFPSSLPAPSAGSSSSSSGSSRRDKSLSPQRSPKGNHKSLPSSRATPHDESKTNTN